MPGPPEKGRADLNGSPIPRYLRPATSTLWSVTSHQQNTVV